MTKSSKATFKRDINYQKTKQKSNGILKKIFKSLMYLFIGFIILGLIGSMLPKAKLTPEQQEELAIKKQEQLKLDIEKERQYKIEEKKEIERTREYANKILNDIYSDIVRHEQHLKDFAITLSKNNVINILEKSKQYKYYARKWAMKSYIEAEDFGATEDDLIEDILGEARSLASFHKIYYDSVDEYLDNQIPSKLLEIKQNSQTINGYKNNVMIKAMTIANKYDLKYNEKKNVWEHIKDTVKK